MLLSELLAHCRREAVRIPDAAPAEAEILVSHVTGIPIGRLFLSEARDVTAAAVRLVPLLERRLAGEPLQYVLGAWDFFGREFILTQDTLIPRPETEGLVRHALDALQKKEGARTLALDVGTGSGAVAVTMAAELQDVRVVATDIMMGALKVARKNARRHGVASRVNFVCCDAYFALKYRGRFDVVVSNPPYVSDEEWNSLSSTVRDFEPIEALRAGPDGLSVLRRLVVHGESLLAPGGELWCEIGAFQGPAAASLPSGVLEFKGIFRDLAGRDRYAGWIRR
ncbi:MAG: peptide chain release factor N(5)-glutamine methyltransferase [Syntrophorhabdaceae bacterium]|nr:peptide chain release factor N(5)-glutamine methyltransferase [Syntrophorhabdaceae bacterium]